MKLPQLFPLLPFSAAFLCVNLSNGQGIFQNLGFENTTIPVGTPPSTPGMDVLFSAAFPGWTGTVNGAVQTTALYNSVALSQAKFALIGPGSPVGGSSIDGNYTAILNTHSLFEPAEVSLFQTGLVPSNALSLRFLGTVPAGLFQGTLSVSLDQTPLSLSVVQEFGSYGLYVADVSAFAGRTAELRFTDSVGVFGNSDFYLDAISFSPNAVPEPSTWALLALGSALFWSAARRRRK